MRELLTVLIEMHTVFCTVTQLSEVAGALGSVKILDKNSSSVVLNWKWGLQ